MIDADRIAHSLLRSDTTTYHEIVKAFGVRILNTEGEINRRELGRIVFSDAGQRDLLNKLTHPGVEAELLRRIEKLERTSAHGIIIVDAALMIETGGYKTYHCLIVVACDPSIQISRIMNRDRLTETEARSRMASQMPIEEKLKLADYTIDASGTLRQTREQVQSIYESLLLRDQSLGSQKH